MLNQSNLSISVASRETWSSLKVFQTLRPSKIYPLPCFTINYLHRYNSLLSLSYSVPWPIIVPFTKNSI